jgi:hypothetical protein
MAEKNMARDARIAGRQFLLRSRDIRSAMRAVDPEPIASHFVVVGGRRFPPKQVISAVTGLDRADFTTHQARRTLMRLGFSAGRRRPPSGSPRAAPHDESGLGDRLRPFAGQWVAIKDEDVLHSASSPQRLVAWLTEHGQHADSMFRVPDQELTATGLAPL